MKKTLSQKRLNAIKLRPVIFPTKCELCQSTISFEKMWIVDRWGINKTIHKWHYCIHCLKNKQQVLNEIDTDSCYFGIALVDKF